MNQFLMKPDEVKPGSYIVQDIQAVLEFPISNFQFPKGEFALHPDSLLVKGEGSIGIDTIRQSIKFLRSTPSIGEHKILVIANFHCATKEAQNAFLKTFEEPPAYAYIFLVTPYVDRLLKTIVSRAQMIGKIPKSQFPISNNFSNSNFQISELLSMSVGERLLWLEETTKKIEDKKELKGNLLGIIDEFLLGGITKERLKAIEYAKEAKWKIEQGFPSPKLLVESLLVKLG